MFKHIRKILVCERGVSLPGIAMVMIISGFMFTIAFAAFKHVLKQDEFGKMYENVGELRGALTEFVAEQGRYPCPADPTLAPGNPNYGVENCALAPTPTTRDLDGVGGPDNILVGAYPYDTVIGAVFNSKIAGVNITDPWGNKYTYAVTQRLTNTVTFNDNLGVISVTDEFDQDIFFPADRAHAVVISHGKNGRGAFSAQGTQVDPFAIVPPGPPPPPGTPVIGEVENADGDGDFVSGLVREVDLFYFDDWVEVVMDNRGGLWQLVDIDASVIPPLSKFANTNPGNVGFGVLDPNERLEIAGSLRGDILFASNFCDGSGANCMPTSRIVGTDTEMACANPGEAVVSISDNQVNCAPAFGSPVVSVSCNPATEHMNGFSNRGRIICCPASGVGSCRTIP